MFLSFELMVAFRYLRAKNKQFLFSIITLFSLLGITLGVATLIIVMSVMNGFSEKLLDNILGVNGHITVNFETKGKNDYNETVKIIKQNPEVISASPLTENQIMVKTGEHNVFGAVVLGITFSDIKNKKIISQSIIDGNIDEFDDGIIIGARLAENLGVKNGDQVTLISPESFTTILGKIPRTKMYKIVGIFDVGMYEYDNMLIYMPLKAAQLFLNYGTSVQNIEVFLRDLNKSPEIAKEIEKAVGMKTIDWQTQQGHYFNALKMESNVMFLILTLIIIVASFNIISSLIILVEGKRTAIAIMRTIGATKGSIMRIFCMCGFFIGAVGTTLGCVIGISFSLNINKIKNFIEQVTDNQLFDPVIYFFSNIPSILLVEDVVKVSLLSLLLSFLAAIPPATKAAAQDPADILRYE